VGDLEAVLMRLEEKGKETNIFKYKEM